MEKWFKKLVMWIWPHQCCMCGLVSNTQQDLCSYCRTHLPWIEDRCYRCGLYLQKREENFICIQCQENPPIFYRLCAIFSYLPPVTHLITGLKFGKQLSNGRLLGEILCDKVMNEWYRNDTLPEAIIPMPLYIKRLRKRGYNQSLELLLPLKRTKKIPLLLDACIRIRSTRPQSELKRTQRLHNARNSFVIRKRLKLKHVAILDDVVTTGSTVKALCEVLNQAGLERIDIWCICRA